MTMLPSDDLGGPSIGNVFTHPETYTLPDDESSPRVPTRKPLPPRHGNKRKRFLFGSRDVTNEQQPRFSEMTEPVAADEIAVAPAFETPSASTSPGSTLSSPTGAPSVGNGGGSDATAFHGAVFPRWTVLVGAFLLQSTTGAIYCFGNLETYLRAWLQAHNTWVQQSAVDGLFALALSVFAITHAVSGYLMHRYGCRPMAIVGVALTVLGTLLCAFLHNFWLFGLSYGIFYASGVGLVFAVPKTCCINWYPHRTGLVTGVTMLGVGIAGALFDLGLSYQVNPRNLGSLQGSTGSLPIFVVPASVYDQLPYTFIYVACAYFVLGAAGCVLLRDVPVNGLDELHKQGVLVLSDGGALSFYRAVRKGHFWALIIVQLCFVMTGLFVLGNYKSFGLVIDTSDHALSNVGAIAAVFQGLASFGGGLSLEKLQYKRALFSLSLLQTALMAIVTYTRLGYITFMLWTFGAFAGFGLGIVLVPAAVATEFGVPHFPKIYGAFAVPYCLAAIGFVFLSALPTYLPQDLPFGISPHDPRVRFLVVTAVCIVGTIAALIILIYPQLERCCARMRGVPRAGAGRWNGGAETDALLERSRGNTL